MASLMERIIAWRAYLAGLLGKQLAAVKAEPDRTAAAEHVVAQLPAEEQDEAAAGEEAHGGGTGHRGDPGAGAGGPASTGGPKVFLRNTLTSVARWAAKIFKRLPVLCILLLAAAVITFVAVIVQSMFTGDTTSRTLGAGVAGVAASLIGIFWQKFGTLFTWVSGREMSARHGVAIFVAVALLIPVGLLHDEWLPGVLHGCYTLPFSGGMTALVETQDGKCYGTIDTAGGLFNPGAFGGNPVTIELERRILEQNQPLKDGDLTVVWLGSLSCAPSPTDSAQCADGRDYPAERDQLRGLLLAQAQIADMSHPRHHLHVVIADATQDVDHIDDVAQLIVKHRAVFGGRLVVIGGSDSRDTTQRAINRLLNDGIPFIAPNLLADLGKPGQPFVDRPGYLQLAPPNQAYATDTVTWIKHRYPAGFHLEVFQLPNPSDQYTTSLVNDLLTAVEQDGRHRYFARHVNSLDRLDTSICQTDRPGPPTVLFFADRWLKFGEFVQRVNDLCGYNAPQWVIADASVGRFMASNPLRADSNANWPLDYYDGGLHCSELKNSDLMVKLVNSALKPADGGTFTCLHTSSLNAKLGVSNGIYCTLDAAKSVSQPCHPNDFGTFVAPAWDAAMLADTLPPRRNQEPCKYLRSLNLPSKPLTEGQAKVQDGQLATPTIPIRMWHVQQVDNPTAPPVPSSEFADDKQQRVSRVSDFEGC
jgi:hypothetical protein